MRFKTQSEPSESEPKSAPKSAPTSIPHRRAYGVLVTILIAAWLIAGAPFPHGPTTSSVELGVVSASADDPVALIGEALTAARQQFASAGSFTGFTYPGTLTAALDDTVLIAAAGSDGTCVYTGIVEGTGNGVLTDPTGAACEQKTIDAAQAALGSVDDATRRAESTTIGDRLRQVIESAAVWSQITFSDGRPSLAGLADQMHVADTTVVSTAADGSSITVEVSVGSSCTQATITAGAVPTVTTTNC